MKGKVEENTVIDFESVYALKTEVGTIVAMEKVLLQCGCPCCLAPDELV